ncbi:tripartite motif-containing protein 30A-like [Microtus ochrogaster]|uniref:Tripartite motif-containing protein 30A-like n=1 Tax=Microtus ochrogaster TaxID=79684 RepID=A0ABM0LPI2_MICOH|nr:tripartite motif-containing protein 30A-like [Microtus ochrogaster]
MASSVLGMVKEEVTCPICLDLMVEPVSADCGHSFCRACITLNYESNKHEEGESICPVCRDSYLFGNLRPNWHLANIVERLTGFKTSSGEEQKVNVCAQHGEKLQLFCEKDMMAICWLCERSQEYCGHHTVLIEEVATKYKAMLQSALEMQMANEERCDQWEDDLQKERTFWEKKIQSNVEKVQKKFKEMHEFLYSEEKNKLQKLRQKEEDIVKRLEKSENDLVKQRESVSDLISDLEHGLQCSSIEMLQGVNHVLTRSQTLSLKQPKMIPRKQRKIFRAPDLKGMMQVFQGLRDAQRYWVHVNLLQLNNKNIVINVDKRQIRHRSGYRRNLQVSESYDLGVLGYPAIYSGKHYWEVDVSRCDAWILGINDGRCAQPQLHGVNQKGFRVIKNSVVKQDVRYQPQYGYWVIGITNRSVYNVFEVCSVPQNASVSFPSLTGSPTRIGVFLDREACTLLFYDVSNHGAPIHRFCDCSSSGALYPYFNPMESSEPMTVCGPPS